MSSIFRFRVYTGRAFRPKAAIRLAAGASMLFGLTFVFQNCGPQMSAKSSQIRTIGLSGNPSVADVSSLRAGLPPGADIGATLGTTNIDFVSIRASVFGEHLTIRAHRNLAYAIQSITWGGQEFVDHEDHGREMQSAEAYDDLGECDNPTEAGGEYDGHWHNPSTSRSLGVNANNNILHTATQMANWQRGYTTHSPPLAYSRGNCATSTTQGPTPDYARNATDLSNEILFKRVAIGFEQPGFPRLENVLNYQVTFRESKPHFATNHEVLAWYLPDAFSEIYDGRPENLGVRSQFSNAATDYPVIVATPDQRFAAAVYCPGTAHPLHQGRVGYIRNQLPNGIDGHVYKIGCMYRQSLTSARDYDYQVFAVLGNLEQVRTALRSLRDRDLERGRRINPDYTLLHPLVFDVAYYKSHTSDSVVRNMTDADATLHWQNFGAAECKRGSALFDPLYYLGVRSDLVNSSEVYRNEATRCKAALHHFLGFGFKEGHRTAADFDINFYLSDNPDVANNYRDPETSQLAAITLPLTHPVTPAPALQFLHGYKHYLAAGIREPNRRTIAPDTSPTSPATETVDTSEADTVSTPPPSIGTTPPPLSPAFSPAGPSVEAQAATCTSFQYSEWGACQDGTRTRAVSERLPANCTGGEPITSESCENSTRQVSPPLRASVQFSLSSNEARPLESVILQMSFSNSTAVTATETRTGNCKVGAAGPTPWNAPQQVLRGETPGTLTLRDQGDLAGCVQRLCVSASGPGGASDEVCHEIRHHAEIRFQAADYLRANPDVANYAAGPARHFCDQVMSGREERPLRPGETSFRFNRGDYLALNRDLADAGLLSDTAVIEHFCRVGHLENRRLSDHY